MTTEVGGKGSFQAVKLQRPARTTVCSHSTRDMAAVYSIESGPHHKNAYRERLCSCEQSYVFVSPKACESREAGRLFCGRANYLHLSWENSDGNSSDPCASV